ncbi:MAG: hypothetical protein ISS15_11850 [Alphaproteobacteria bacterium]|nr:hypothetical protein [Alphaproteobacteria bacterium]MBL6936604.1 hypothetical protein [Alphaproteobacteria bacterium]MBL7098345.1 hypothetical protein [Alphaproteobacteria bacterium]
MVGDSIALGVGTEMHRCVVNATVGLPSADIIGRVQHANVVVISAGSNDAHSPALEDNLRAIRERAVNARVMHVIWISPMDPRAAAAVQRVARLHGDRVVHFKPRPDNIHPKSYPTLADRVTKAMRGI